MGDGGTIVDTDGLHKLDGTFLLGDVANTVDALRNGDWVSAGLLGVADTLDVAATVSDPFGSLLAAGAGWLIDHFQPLKGWMDDLTGDAAAVEALAVRWEEVSHHLGEQADDLRSRVHIDLADMEGLSIEAYRSYIDTLAQTVDGLGDGADGVASAIKVAAMLVEVVHGLVRDTIAQLAGAAASWLAEEFFSAGLATGWVIEQVETRVSALAAKIGSTVKGLVESCHALEELVTKLDGVVGKIRSALDELHPGAARGKHAAPWLSGRGARTPGAGSHVGPIESIGKRYLDVGTKEAPYNALTEGYVGESNATRHEDEDGEEPVGGEPGGREPAHAR